MLVTIDFRVNLSVEILRHGFGQAPPISLSLTTSPPLLLRQLYVQALGYVNCIHSVAEWVEKFRLTYNNVEKGQESYHGGIDFFQSSCGCFCFFLATVKSIFIHKETLSYRIRT